MPAPDHPTLPTPCYRGCGRMLRCRLCMGYGARARVQVGMRTEVEPVWNQPPSLAPVSLPFAVLGPLPCAHLAQNPPSRCDPNGVFYPVLRHRGWTLDGEYTPTNLQIHQIHCVFDRETNTQNTQRWCILPFSLQIQCTPNQIHCVTELN